MPVKKHTIIIKKTPNKGKPEDERDEREEEDSAQVQAAGEDAGEPEEDGEDTAEVVTEEDDAPPVARVRVPAQPAAKASLKHKRAEEFVEVTMIETTSAPTVGGYSVRAELGFTSLLKGKRYSLPYNVALVLADHGKGTFNNPDVAPEVPPNRLKKA